MPEIVAHHFFGMKVLQDLPQDIRKRIDPELFRKGVRGPDPLGIVRFWCPPIWRKLHGRSSEMHTLHSGAFFERLSREARAQAGELQTQLFSYECGFLTHYFLDSVCHPYVIYRTGLGEAYTGNHRSLEHAMDRLALARNGLTLRNRPISRLILPEKGLPRTMKRAIDAVYAETFGWTDAWKQINHALKDERRFVRLIEDPAGWLARFTKGGTPGSLSYAENAYTNADIENEQHQEWRNPYEPAMTSDKSFGELTELAGAQAKQAICDLYAFILGEAPYPVSIGNRSYESGLDTTDPRNKRDPRFEVLQRL